MLTDRTLLNFITYLPKYFTDNGGFIFKKKKNLIKKKYILLKPLYDDSNYLLCVPIEQYCEVIIYCT